MKKEKLQSLTGTVGVISVFVKEHTDVIQLKILEELVSN